VQRRERGAEKDRGARQQMAIPPLFDHFNRFSVIARIVLIGLPVGSAGAVEASVGSKGRFTRRDNSLSVTFARGVGLCTVGVLSELGLANDHITLERSRLEVVPANADRIASQKPSIFCVALFGQYTPSTFARP